MTEIKKPLTKAPKKRKKRKLSKETRAKYAENMRRVRQNRESNMTVDLRMNHFVNGQIYGPGRVTLPSSLAQQFLSEEERQAQQLSDLHVSKAVIIGRPGRTGAITTTRVAPETFEDSMGDPNLMAGKVF